MVITIQISFGCCVLALHVWRAWFRVFAHIVFYVHCFRSFGLPTLQTCENCENCPRNIASSSQSIVSILMVMCVCCWQFKLFWCLAIHFFVSVKILTQPNEDPAGKQVSLFKRTRILINTILEMRRKGQQHSSTRIAT